MSDDPFEEYDNRATSNEEVFDDMLMEDAAEDEDDDDIPVQSPIWLWGLFPW